MNGFFLLIICLCIAGCSVAFMPLQQQKLQPRTLTRRFGLTGMTMTNHSTDNPSIDTRVALLEQQGVTLKATLERIEKNLNDNNVRLEKKLDNLMMSIFGIYIILTALCTLLAQHFDEIMPILNAAK
jgi:hypothetical protein